MSQPDLLAAPDDWQRLDRRMMLVYPVREVGRFIVPLLAFFVAGTATGRPWQYLTIVVPVALGVGRYLTTRYRVANGRVELRRGLVSRHVLSAPVERVRSVDLTASPVHRVLGLVTVKIGTGTASTDGDEKLDLDGLPVAQAHALRAQLLRVAAPPAPPGPLAEPVLGPDGVALPAPAPPPEPAPERVALVFSPAWLRFAPFTSAGIVIAAALVGGGSQLLGSLDLWDDLHPEQWVVAVSLWVAVVVGLVVVALASVVLSVVGYLLTNWGFRLSHGGGSWHVRRGLLTTRETSIDDERVAGVTLHQPLGLRWARGSRLGAIVTGLRTTQGDSALVPPAPRAAVEHAAATVLGTAEPVHAPLVRHGAAATRRRYLRALVPGGLLVAAAVLARALEPGVPWWVVALAVVLLALLLGLAADRARGLGHGFLAGHVVARSGSLLREREALAAGHVIGWNLRSTYFQRRQGLVTLVATTAGGDQRVEVLDVPEQLALALVARATPTLFAEVAEVAEVAAQP
ncbi:PH domain-containing protein [Nocardioides nanhaiensis]|uniref:YdbS-like PH domain-containing protein n=1 Tax=Nocardioides nanhaiensis TaxID=1476871 RepID=A0ABP8WV89_9ACTN